MQNPPPPPRLQQIVNIRTVGQDAVWRVMQGRTVLVISNRSYFNFSSGVVCSGVLRFGVFRTRAREQQQGRTVLVISNRSYFYFSSGFSIRGIRFAILRLRNPKNPQKINRLTTIQLADEVAVVGDNGRVLETGTFEQLAGRPGSALQKCVEERTTLRKKNSKGRPAPALQHGPKN